ncbi:MAG TPA: tetratricopeptide repeat protein, partial [Anaerolineae bacterium]|nr:tetratricopeptide repeat protein [Anaerolineae bacterium]
MNLPPSYNLFIGRTRELVEIQDALQEYRLVTLTGPGGCGKTRLALECVRQLNAPPAGHLCADGVTWCDLAAVTDPDYVPSRLVTALGLTERTNVSSTDLISEALQFQTRLVVLDNCEHLLAACATLAEALLEKCSHLTIFATSTQPLGLAQEHLYGVPPLAVPEPPASWSAETLAALSESEAVRLFLQRAREIFPGFELTLQNIAAIVTICRRLDGLPLAIELAAARVKMLAPAQIVERLDDAFTLLTRGRPEAWPKHQTLRATLDWSYQLLSAPEQILLRRLSVFAGSFDVEMVEAVCDHDLQTAPLDVLTDLVDKSLVSIWRHDQATVRYGLLETIRQYAHEQLDAAGERERLIARHLDWCVKLAEQAEPELKAANQAGWFARLELEHDNLRAALQGALEARLVESGLWLAGTLERFWWVRGHLMEGGQWLERLLSHRPDPSDDQARSIQARALFVAGVLAYRQNDYARAEVCFQACLRQRQMLEDSAGIALVLNNLGNVALDRGEFARATALYQESLRLRREMNDAWGTASLLNNLGNCAADQREYDQAVTLYTESLVLYRQLGDQWSVASCLNNLGEVARWQGDGDRAEAL